MRDHTIGGAALEVGVFLERSELSRAVRQGIVVAGLVFARSAAVLEKGGHLPACRKLKLHDGRTLALARKIEKEHGEVEKPMLLVQDTPERRFTIQVDVITHHELRTALPAKTPRAHCGGFAAGWLA